MRYEELSLPIADNKLAVRFHPRLTILAGLSGPSRDSMIEAISAATAGETPGARVTLVDLNSRRTVVGERSDDEVKAADIGPTRRVRNLLEVTAEDLGLPRPSDDPGQLEIQRNLIAVRNELELADGRLRSARDARALLERLTDELAAVDSELAQTGSDTDRYVHNRTKALLELEQIRTTLDALDAPPAQRARDRALIDSTIEIQELAQAWSMTSAQLDHLRADLTSADRLDSDQIAAVVDVPDAIPTTLRNLLTEHQRQLTSCDELQVEMEKAMAAPAIATPSDSRVMVLSLLDQQTLWMTHRDVLLATEALQVAEAEEQQLAMVDPAERVAIERAHQNVEDATNTAEKRWLTGILAATICACAAGTLAIIGMFTLALPVLLVLSVASLVLNVARPKYALHAARRYEAALLEAVGATTLNEYLHRFNDDPDSEHWRRVEQIIEDYQSAMEEWRYLVGHITPGDATLLEPQVHAWITVNDPAHREASSTAVRRRLERAKIELSQTTSRLNEMLEPYGVVAEREPVTTAVEVRVRLGHQARRQLGYDDAVEVEGKLTRQLGAQLESLGFESGNLAARISAYGRELDAALVRQQLRESVHDSGELTTRRQTLEAKLAVPAPVTSTRATTEDPRLTELRNKRDRLRGQLEALETPDLSGLERTQQTLAERARSLEALVTTDGAMLVEHPVDHLVETLIAQRPIWPTTGHEAAPAILNDPFASLAPQVQRRLLEALDEIAKVTQIILLTDDPAVANWAQNKAEHGLATMVAPRSRAARSRPVSAARSIQAS